MSREWTCREHETMLRLTQDGFTAREISRKIGRSFHAVASRLQQRKVYRPLRLPEPPVVYERVTIEKSQVPEWYEAGWRFVGFEGELCAFERPKQ